MAADSVAVFVERSWRRCGGDSIKFLNMSAASRDDSMEGKSGCVPLTLSHFPFPPLEF